MAQTIWKVGKRDDTATVEVYDNDGTMEIRVDGTKVLSEQQTAIADLTDSTGGTADGTLADVGASFSQATLNNNFADVAAKLNAIIAALEAHGIVAS